MPFKLHKKLMKLLSMGLFMAVMVGMCSALTACGKMPRKVDAPEGVDSKMYYQTYPDLSTDPEPVQ